MKRKIIISNKEFTMPKMSIDTYTEYLDIAEQIDTHPRYTKQDIEIMEMSAKHTETSSLLRN